MSQKLLERYSGATIAEVTKDPQILDRAQHEFYRAHISELEAILSSSECLNPQLMDFCEQNDEMRFFLLVSLPCWLEHGASAKSLFDNARSGDFDSMRKLLSIDPDCLEDAELRRQHAMLMEKSNEVRRRMLAAASSLEPLRELTQYNVKIALAAYIYKVWASVETAFSGLKAVWPENFTAMKPDGFTMKYPKIEALFHAAYIDQHPGAFGDPDLTATPDAFRQAVKRQLDFWPDFVAPFIPNKISF